VNRSVLTGVAVLIVAGVICALSSLFSVYQTEQAIVLRFGEPIRIIKDPGLHVKWPFIDSLVRIDNRILDLDLPAREATANDQQRLVVDAFSRYKITDPLVFRQAAGSIEVANARLTNLLTDALLEAIRSSTFTEIVRTKRDEIMMRIRDQANREAKRFGITVVDVRIRRADLPEQNSQSVFERMRTDRQQEAAGIRAFGGQQGQTIRAKADREAAVILADANKQAEELRGQGDGERSKIFADAYTKDRDFFAFYRSMQAYDTALDANQTKIVLSPDSAFFRYFGDGPINAPMPTGGHSGAPARP